MSCGAAPRRLPRAAGRRHPMLEVEAVAKSYAALQALDDVSLRVDKARIVGLVGPNGSGKSTLFDIITGFQRRDRGRMPKALLRLPNVLRIERENLARAREVLALLGLSRVGNEVLGNLSGGQRKLVDLGRISAAPAPIRAATSAARPATTPRAPC
jgi:ABC-type branched-subunit amino acid transport system ATPase component